jgi:glycosyltransferase involved in cell wall biosynthesis
MPDTVAIRPRVLFFPPVPDFKGGAERSLFDLLRNPNIEPYLVVPGTGPISAAAEAEGVPVDTIDLGGVAAIRRPITARGVAAAGADWTRAARRLVALCRERRIDIVHSNGMKAHCIAGLARLLGGRPTVFHVRDIAVRGSERAIWRMLARFSDHLIVVSRACWPGERMPGNVSVVHNGVSPTPRPSGPVARPGEPRLTTLGFCGRIHPFKGLDVLLEWLAYARAQGADARLVVRGEAAEEDAGHLATLHRMTADLGLADRVRFEGRVDGLAAVYAGLDAVVVPSTVPDPLPRSVMEAMSLGLPVIGYPAGGIPDMIESGSNGWLVSNGQEFLQALADVSRGGTEIERIRLGAWESINQKFLLGTMYEKIDAIYGKFLKTKVSVSGIS